VLSCENEERELQLHAASGKRNAQLFEYDNRSSRWAAWFAAAREKAWSNSLRGLVARSVVGSGECSSRNYSRVAAALLTITEGRDSVCTYTSSCEGPIEFEHKVEDESGIQVSADGGSDGRKREYVLPPPVNGKK